MDERDRKIVVGQMKPHKQREWGGITTPKRRIKWDKRLLRKSIPLAAAFFCLGIAAVTAKIHGEDIQSVFEPVTAQFDYDDTLGRLQFVSKILPESAMVFLTGSDEIITCASLWEQEVLETPTWSESEPWLEFRETGNINSCLAGEVMSVVKNRKNEYTVRILHKNGYESVYSGLKQMLVSEGEEVVSGQAIGCTEGFAAFELRKDGLSIMPVFGG